MFYKVFLCIPIVIKLSVMILMLYFIYGVIAVEIFTTLPPIEVEESPFS